MKCRRLCGMKCRTDELSSASSGIISEVHIEII